MNDNNKHFAAINDFESEFWEYNGEELSFRFHGHLVIGNSFSITPKDYSNCFVFDFIERCYKDETQNPFYNLEDAFGCARQRIRHCVKFFMDNTQLLEIKERTEVRDSLYLALIVPVYKEYHRITSILEDLMKIYGEDIESTEGAIDDLCHRIDATYSEGCKMVKRGEAALQEKKAKSDK